MRQTVWVARKRERGFDTEKSERLRLLSAAHPAEGLQGLFLLSLSYLISKHSLAAERDSIKYLLLTQRAISNKVFFFSFERRAAEALTSIGQQPRGRVERVRRKFAPIRLAADATTAKRLGGHCRALDFFGQQAAGLLLAPGTCVAGFAQSSPFSFSRLGAKSEAGHAVTTA